MPCGAGVAWGLVSTGDRGPAVTRAGGAPLFRQWRVDAADTRALAVSGRGSDQSGVGACGPVRRNAEWDEPRMHSNIYDLFKLIQTSSN
jgi:hypothetical protein